MLRVPQIKQNITKFKYVRYSKCHIRVAMQCKISEPTVDFSYPLHIEYSITFVGDWQSYFICIITLKVKAAMLRGQVCHNDKYIIPCADQQHLIIQSLNFLSGRTSWFVPTLGGKGNTGPFSPLSTELCVLPVSKASLDKFSKVLVSMFYSICVYKRTTFSNFSLYFTWFLIIKYCISYTCFKRLVSAFISRDCS